MNDNFTQFFVTNLNIVILIKHTNFNKTYKFLIDKHNIVMYNV